MSKRIRLKAENPADMEVIAALLQDAVVAVRDMTYTPHNRRFGMIVSRFIWEEGTGAPRVQAQAGAHQRVMTGVHFDGVLSVESQNMSPPGNPRPLELLTIHCGPVNDGAATIMLIFSGDSAVRLRVEYVDCHLSDVGEVRDAGCRPRHPMADHEVSGGGRS